MKIIKQGINDLKSKNVVVRSSIIIFFIVSLVMIYKKDMDKFQVIVDFYGAIITSALTIMTFTKLNANRTKYYSYLGVGFIYISFLIFIQVDFHMLGNSNIYDVFLVMSISYFQIVIMFLAKTFTQRSTKMYIANLIYIVSFTVIFIGTTFSFHLIDRLYTLSTFYIINILLTLLSGVLILGRLSREDIIGNTKSKQRVLLFIIFITCSNLLKYVTYLSDIEFYLLFSFAFKFIAYIFLYLFIEENVLNIYYDYTKVILIKNQNELRDTNKALILNNKNLEESKKLLQKSDKSYISILNSINKGIFLFSNDKLQHINSAGKNYLKVSSYTGLDYELEYILWNITDEIFSNDELYYGFMRDFVVKNNGESINIRVYLLPIDKNKKFILVTNTSEVQEYRHLSDYLKSYLFAEKSREDFYSNVSHELRTPINVISSALQLNEMYLKNQDYERITKYNTVIRQNCLRLIRTINNFIDADKLEGGYFDVVAKRQNIIYIIDEVIDASVKYFKKSNTEIIFDPECEEIYLPIDRGQFQRVILNIFSNTIKYGKSEGGKVDVTVRTVKRNVEISIHNDAPPIPEDKRRYIFDKFTKVDSSLARPSEGSGLGLFLTKALIEANNGSVELYSDESGNTFRIVFQMGIYGYEEAENDEMDAQMDLEEKVDIEFADVYF
ncbi:MAG: ATP-binding protein [Clostridium sp.]